MRRGATGEKVRKDKKEEDLTVLDGHVLFTSVRGENYFLLRSATVGRGWFVNENEVEGDSNADVVIESYGN
ncbi:MAG: hypothetical protein EZS28_043570 [Streblomastix strix]|uniref:Uncharacterized protein n=1 Tax=Streblomastix strix TaxID=222440 RepID=A0A5J4TRC2_9EUKA|nr:MAG: hypothetical protein EZS28_043570 [Streblomastix strix]